MVTTAKIGGCLAALVLLTGCGGRVGFQAPNAASERNVAIALLLAYDSDQNQLISRSEFEGALRTDYDTLDRNDDGALDRIEVGRENDRRWAESGIASTPLIDWNSDGFVDFTEFAATVRATFRQLDTDEDGSLSTEELAAVEVRQPPGPGPRPDRPPPGGMIVGTE